ncbi:MAG: zf-HC2 domain-containing protein [Sedimentisphaerales bacterium]|nr:zf-HC2 domain-containing protein [Sedimentisphaerales bacterium]
MSRPCEKMQNRIVDLMLGVLGQIDRDAVHHHIRGCERCRQFYFSLQRQQDLLGGAGKQLEQDISSRCAETVGIILALPDEALPKPIPVWKTLFFNRTFQFASVACLVVAVLVGFALVMKGGDKESSLAENTADPVKIVSPAEPKPETISKSKSPIRTVVLTEVDIARRKFAAGDVQGLIDLLQNGDEQVQLVAADFLAQIGDQSAMRALLQAAQDWQGPTEENPYIEALRTILARMNPAEPNDTQESKSPVTDTIASTTPNNAIKDTSKKPWPSLSETVTDIHMTATGSGFQSTAQTWIRLPDQLREDGMETDLKIIDDGAQRLELNTKTKVAQFTTSSLNFSPLTEHDLYRMATMFRDGSSFSDIVFERTEDLTHDSTVKYLVTFAGQLQMTAWVNEEYMLPVRVDMEKGLLTLEYNPIPDNVFAMQVPNGYTLADQKQGPGFSGQVVDLSGRTVSGAQVRVRVISPPEWKNNKLMSVSDLEGNFSLEAPSGKDYSDPILLWANIPGEPDFVAWTILAEDLSSYEHFFSGPLPGDPGMETKTSSGSRWIEEVTLVMMPAGKIIGQITDGNGDAVAGAEITARFLFVDRHGIHNPNFDSLPWISSSRSDLRGHYILGQLPVLAADGQYEVQVTAIGYSNTAEVFITEAPLEVKQLDFVLLPAGITVHGVLQDNYGEFLSQRTVHVEVEGHSIKGCQALTDAQGRFRLEGCPVGFALSIVADLQYEYANVNGQPVELDFYPQTRAIVPYEEGITEYEVELVAEKPELAIGAQLMNSAGQPLPLFPVFVKAQEGHFVKTPDNVVALRTDEEGFCKFTDIPNAPGLALICDSQHRMPDDTLSTEQAQQIQEQYKDFRALAVPVEVVSGQNDYFFRVEVLTYQEYGQP